MSEKENISKKEENTFKKEHKSIGININIKYVSKTDYTLKFEFIVQGKVQKNDLMGAIYNHGSHLFEDLTLEKLQNSRKLGRFNINLVYSEEGHTIGEFTVPLIADKLQAAIVGANLETIEKCGPYNQKIKLKQVINEKSEIITRILERAKQIYDTKFKASINSISQLRSLLKDETNQSSKYVVLDESANIYGGPYHSRSQVYLVEGLNDIKKLIEYNIYNTISVNGGNFSSEKLNNLLEDKEVTILFDQDRGGKMLEAQIGKLVNATYVVRVPENMCIENIDKNTLFESIYSNKTLFK